MNKIHRPVGILTVIIFLFTGIYMKINFPGLYAHNEAIRFMFRANHIYILLAGLLNIAIGTYFIFTPKKWMKNLQFGCSSLLLISPTIKLLSPNLKLVLIPSSADNSVPPVDKALRTFID